MKQTLVFAVWNLKGGVGKTVTAVNLAFNLAEKNKNVLLIDADPQMDATPYYIRPYKNKYSVFDLITHPEHAARYIYRTKYKNIDIIKGSADLEDQLCVKYAFEVACSKICEKRNYDYIIIDCRTSCEALTTSVMEAADVVLTPILLDGSSKDNLLKVKFAINRIKTKNNDLCWYIFANRVKNTRRQRRILEELMQKHSYPILELCIFDREAVPSALSLKKPLVKHASKNQATLDFIELTEEIMTLTEVQREG